MKTSNKLLLGLFVLILVAITFGFVYLKAALKEPTSINSKRFENQTKEQMCFANFKRVVDGCKIYKIYI